MHDTPISLPRPESWTTRTYAELRAAAARCLRRERRRPTLAPTELLHDAWLKLHASTPPADSCELGLAVHAMREALVDHARRREAAKRGAGSSSARFPARFGDPCEAAGRDTYVVALDEALQELEAHDAELARMVELRFFAGLGVDAVAAALGLSARTVKRRWRFAKGWLHQRIERS